MKTLIIIIDIVFIALSIGLYHIIKPEALEIKVNDDLTGISKLEIKVSGDYITRHRFRCKNGEIIIENKINNPIYQKDFVFIKVNDRNEYIYSHSSIVDQELYVGDQKCPIVIIQCKYWDSSIITINDGIIAEGEKITYTEKRRK